MLTLICVNHVNPGLKQYLGMLIEKKTMPAKGKMSIVYYPLNRPVLMQDALMNSNNQWNYIRYDVKGRAISQGIYTDGTHLGRSLKTWEQIATWHYYRRRPKEVGVLVRRMLNKRKAR